MNTTEKTRKATKNEIKQALKGLYWHPVTGWMIDCPNIRTPIPKPSLDCIAYTVQIGD